MGLFISQGSLFQILAIHTKDRHGALLPGCSLFLLGCLARGALHGWLRPPSACHGAEVTPTRHQSQGDQIFPSQLVKVLKCFQPSSKVLPLLLLPDG